MSKILKISYKIDITYAINSFIYNLKKFPIFKELFPGNSLYESKKAKQIIQILALILSITRMVLYKIVYFMIIYMLAKFISKQQYIPTLLHVYFIFTLIGIIINNKILSTSTKKYFSIVLFNMNAKEFMKANLLIDLITNFIIHSICLLVLVKNPVVFIYTIFQGLGRIIGERINLVHYKKYKIPIIYNYPLYWTVIILGMMTVFLPIINIKISNQLVFIIMLIFIPFAIYSYYKLMKVTDYKLIYKKINTKKAAINSNQEPAYTRQAMLAIKDKDKSINPKKIKNKTGYDLFNIIFFERHKEILLRSAKWYGFISFIIIVFIGIVVLLNQDVKNSLNIFLKSNISWFVIIMYFINRGAIITQAMFYNCDHSMLKFNFYRNPNVILNVFKKRVLTVTKVNLIPAIVIAIGLPILLYLSGGSTNFLDYISMPIFIITLSIFFSIHYLVIYYLFQPYDKNMKMKSLTYSIISMLTYFIAYSLTDFKMSTTIFSMLAIIITVIYNIIALIVVYKKSPTTFKIK